MKTRFFCVSASGRVKCADKEKRKEQNVPSFQAVEKVQRKLGIFI